MRPATDASTRSGPPRAASRRDALVALALALVLAGGCNQRSAPPSYVIVGITNSVLNLDPRVGSDEASQKAHQLLFNSLVWMDDDLRIVPELAETLEQPDPLTYVARLRRGVMFHNGRELAADDVVYTFRSFLDPAFRGRSGAYRLVAAVQAIDRYTVEFTLKEPFASFPINLVMALFGDVVRGNFQMNTLQFVGVTDPDMLRRVFHSRQAPPAGLNRVFYENPEVDRLIESAASAPDDVRRRAFYARAQQAIAEDVPNIGLWYKTNVAVFQPDIHGVQLSPIADFTFLKDVYRQAR